MKNHQYHLIMVRKCLVPGCGTSSKSPEFSLHKFPKKNSLKEAWNLALGLNPDGEEEDNEDDPLSKTGSVPGRGEWVCSKHFKDKDFVRKNKARPLKGSKPPNLRPDAIPR